MNRKNRHSIDVVFVLVLFGTFAISVLMVLMVGASSYNDVTDNMNSNYEDRTGVGYIAEKVRHFDADGGIGTGNFDGINSLILTQTIDGREYATYIYYYDGSIRELFTEKDNELPPESGEVIIQAAGFSAEPVSDNMIKVTCIMEDGQSPYVILSPRSEKTGASYLTASAGEGAE